MHISDHIYFILIFVKLKINISSKKIIFDADFLNGYLVSSGFTQGLMVSCVPHRLLYLSWLVFLTHLGNGCCRLFRRPRVGKMSSLPNGVLSFNRLLQASFHGSVVVLKQCGCLLKPSLRTCKRSLSRHCTGKNTSQSKPRLREYRIRFFFLRDGAANIHWIRHQYRDK